jgi:methylmalonyl-CoA carboxyltransferase large subunit
MNSVTTKRDTAESVEELRRQVAALADRVALLEGAAGATPISAGGKGASQLGDAADRKSAAGGEVTPEIAAIIAATIAAYLGVKPHIRQISLVGGASWAQQGRVSIQASHALAIQRD